MAALLGLAAAVTYGAADFVGGFVSRRTAVITVVLLSQAAGSVILALVFPAFDNGPVDATAVWWGAASGVAGSIGVCVLYRALAHGRMSVVAPTTAVIAAAIPVVFGLATGERPSATSLAGVAVALGAVALVSLSGEPGRVEAAEHRGAAALASGALPAIGAGLAFATFFILLKRADPGSGLWPLAGSRMSSLIVVGAAAAVTRTSLRPAPGTGRGIAAAGVLDVIANVFYLLATRLGLLSLVVVLTSLYPVSTVVLARLVLRERLGLPRLAGLAAAAVGIALIALG